MYINSLASACFACDIYLHPKQHVNTSIRIFSLKTKQYYHINVQRRLIRRTDVKSSRPLPTNLWRQDCFLFPTKISQSYCIFLICRISDARQPPDLTIEYHCALRCPKMHFWKEAVQVFKLCGPMM